MDAHEGVSLYLNELGVKRFTLRGETAEEIYETMYLRDFEKPPKEEFLLKVVEKTNEYLMTILRGKRNELLTQSDWTQVNDIILSNKEEWKTYRQALRDLPATVVEQNIVLDSNLTNVVFPTLPS